MPVDKNITYNNPVVQGGVDNYLGKQPQVQAPRKWQSAPDKPATELAYITEAEKDLILKANIHGGLEGGPNMGPSGIMSLDSFGDIGGAGASGGDTDAGGGYDTGPGGGGFTGRNTNTTTEREFDRQKANQRAALQIAERAQANRLGYKERAGIANRTYGPMQKYSGDGFLGGYKGGGSKFGGLGNLLMSGIGMLMGIPGLGLITGGFGKLKDGLGSLNDKLGDFREKTTGFRTQAEYDAARQQRQLQGRLDNMYDRKSKGKNFSQKNMDMLEAMGLQPSTAQNVLTGRDLKGFTPSRMGLQTTMTPMSKPTFSDPFANTVGTTTKVNAPSNDAVSSYSYGTADAAIPNVQTNPSYINEFLNKPITPGKSLPGTSFIDRLYNPEQIVELENKFGNAYQIGNSAAGPLSDARHMSAMNNLSNTLSKSGLGIAMGLPSEFAGDIGAFGAGLINEIPALGRGFNKQNLGEIVEDIKANYAGSFGTPNQTTSEDIYNQVFGNQQMAQLGPSFADGGLASMFTRRGIVAQITDQKFKELYEQFQIEKNNLGSDSQFAEFLNKKNINPGVLNKKAGGFRTGVKNKTFNEKTVSGRRQRLKIKPPKNTLVGRAAENRNKVDKLLRKEITKANNKDKFITSNKISFIVEDKLNFKPRLDKGKRVPRFNAAKAGQKAYPILSELDSRSDKVDKVLRDLLIDEKPLEDRLVQVIKKKTNVGDNRTTLKILRATPTFAAIAEDGAELLIQAPTMLDYKGQNLTDQLDTALNKQLAQPVYTGLGGVRSRFYSPAYVTMKFAIENWNRNKGQGPVEFFDKKGNRIDWERGAKLPIRNVSFKYNNKTHKYDDLNKKAYIEKNFPEVYKKTIAANALKAKKINNPFEPGKKITVKDLVKKIQVDGYKWSPRFATLDILHGPKGIKGEPFTNLRYNTKDINHLEAGLSQNVQSGKLSKSEYNQSVKEINKTFKGLQGTDYDQAIIDRVTTQAEKIKKGTFYGFDQFKNIIKQNIISRATNNDNNICEVVFGAKGQANGGPVGGGCAKQMELEFDKAPEQTLNKIAQSSDSTLKGFAQRSLSLFPKLGTVGKIGTVAAGAGIALSGLRFNPEKGEIVTTDNDQKADQNQILQYVKDNPLKVTAGTSLGFAAQEVPGAYKAARDLGRGRVRSTLGISGAIRPVLTTFGTPLITGLYEGAIGAKRLDEGETMTDILTDPVGPALGLTLMEPLSKLSGVVKDAPKRTMLEGAKNYFNLSNVGQARPGLTGQILRMGLSPRMIAGASRFLGLPGIALGAGLAGYDAYKNYQNQEGMIYNLFNKDG